MQKIELSRCGLCACVHVFVGVRDLIHELALVYKGTALLCSLRVDDTCTGGIDHCVYMRLNACKLIFIQCFVFACLSQEL